MASGEERSFAQMLDELKEVHFHFKTIINGEFLFSSANGIGDQFHLQWQIVY